jgi:hypothetical protein
LLRDAIDLESREKIREIERLDWFWDIQLLYFGIFGNWGRMMIKGIGGKGCGVYSVILCYILIRLLRHYIFFGCLFCFDKGTSEM